MFPCAPTSSRLGLNLKVRLENLVSLWRCVVLAKLIDGRCHEGRPREFPVVPARLRWQDLRLACAPHRLPTVAAAAGTYGTLAHAGQIVVAPRDPPVGIAAGYSFSEPALRAAGDREISSVGCLPCAASAALRRPVRGGRAFSLSRKFWKLASARCSHPRSLPMLPTLVGVDRIVASAAGLVREPGGKPGVRVVGAVVVTKVVMAVARPQKEMADEYARVNHRRR